jgi:hypothetical protein
MELIAAAPPRRTVRRPVDHINAGLIQRYWRDLILPTWVREAWESRFADLR